MPRSMTPRSREVEVGCVESSKTHHPGRGEAHATRVWPCGASSRTRRTRLGLSNVKSCERPPEEPASLFDHGGQLFAFGIKFHRYGVHAMPRVLRREPFSHEDVAEMPAAVLAEDLGAGTVAV